MRTTLPVLTFPEYAPEDDLLDLCDLSCRNRKLGEDKVIWSWSIPPIYTCPGKSQICASVCYACSGHFNWRDVILGHWRAYRLSLRPDFADWMIKKINKRKIPVVRWHVAGDLFSAEYAHKVLTIFAGCPDTRFFLYTRSWSVPAIRAILYEMAALENVYLWLSADRETGQPAEVPRARIAYMLAQGDTPPDYPVDLFFRDEMHEKGVIHKYLNDTLVCPQEQGNGHITTCSKCKLCFAHKPTRRNHERDHDRPGPAGLLTRAGQVSTDSHPGSA